MITKDCKTVMYCAGLMTVLLLWFFVFAAEMSIFFLLRSVLLIILSYIAMVFDINTKRIPNALVLVMIFGWLMLMALIILFNAENGLRFLSDSIFGLLTGGGLFLLIYVVSRKGLGGGDVKFMAAAGLYLGFAETVPAIFYGTLLAAVTGLILFILKRLGRKDTFPLVPFLFIGIMITIFTK